MKYLLALAMLLGVLSSSASADIVLSEDFSYGDGDLTTVSGSLWANHSGTGNPVQVNSGAVVLEHGGGSREDVNRGLGAVMGSGDIWRFEFDVTVSGTGDATDTYFAHFKDDATGFNARAFVAAPVSGGDFTFGISEGSSVDTTFATDFSYDTTYRLFAEYNFDTGLSAMWIDDPSTTIFSTNADIGQGMTSMAFRQAGGNTTMTIDNLVVTAVPEPSSFALLSLFGMGMVGYRRRRAA